MLRNQLHINMQIVSNGISILTCSWQKYSFPSCLPTLSVSRMAGVDIEGLLTLPDGGSQGKICLHYPLLVVAVDDRLCGHGQRVTLGYILCQGGKRLFGLKETQMHMFIFQIFIPPLSLLSVMGLPCQYYY